MGQQIIFFRKNLADYEKTWASATASEGSSTAANVLDRSNRTAWATSGSVDANNTTLTINFGDVVTLDSILLLKHNFKNFKIQYWDDVGAAWADFSTPIAPTTNTAASSYYNTASTLTSKLMLTIYGTQVVDSDKMLCQFIATTKLGQLQGWPVMAKPTIARGIIPNEMLSGKYHVLPTVGRYSVSLIVANWTSDADLTVVESLFGSSEGFLVWPCGGDETQFKTKRQGYRLEDIFLVRCKNEYMPELVKGLYQAGVKMELDLIEVIT